MRQILFVLVLSTLVLDGSLPGDSGGQPKSLGTPAAAGAKDSRCDSLATATKIDPAAPASSALAINEALRTRLYERVLRSGMRNETSARAIDSDIDELACLLDSLAKLDTSIAAFSRGEEVEDNEILYYAERNRAAAWLHGWAVFSRLIQEASQPGVDATLREKLLGGDDASNKLSAFDLLLSCYRQMRETTNRFRTIGLAQLARDAARQVERLKSEGMTGKELSFAEKRREGH